MPLFATAHAYCTSQNCTRNCYGAQCIMGRTIKIAVVFTQHGVGLVRSASGGLTWCQKWDQNNPEKPEEPRRPKSETKLNAIKAN